MAPQATGERVDVRDRDAVVALFERLRPDAVIHTAYRQGTPDAWDINVVGSGNVAHAAALIGARLVHVSTDVVFDGRKGAPYVETDAPSPCTDYGRSKAEAEQRVAAAHPDPVLVRTSLLIGGPGHESSPHERAALDPERTFYTDEVRSPVQVTDLARALLQLALLDVSGPLHVAGDDGLSRADLAELLAGRPVRRSVAPRARPLDCRLDSGRARSLLGAVPRGVREVFAR